MDELSEQISSAVDSLTDHMIESIQRLVQTPSLPGEEQGVQELVAGMFEKLGLEVERLPARREELQSHPAFRDDGLWSRERINVVGRWRTSAGSQREAVPSLILNGHVDVVSPGDEKRWQESPWSGVVRDGKLYGRGSCDMKAGLAAAIFAIEALQSLGFQPRGDVVIESVIGEESGGIGTLTTLVKGVRADAAILLEPTRLRICPVQSGALTFRIRVKGRSVHACMKNTGVSAIDETYLLLAALEDLDRDRHLRFHNPLYEDALNVAPISVGTIHGGTWHSTVPDEVVVEGRYGVFPEESIESAQRLFLETIERAAANDPWLKTHPPAVEWFDGQFESGQTDLGEPIVQVLAASHRQITGAEPELQGVTYGSDLRLFTNHGGIPAVLYGPGDVANAHAVNEFVDLEEVVTATKVLARTLHSWSEGEQQR